ncbi:MAG: amidohydrolase [Sphingomonadaceae bacterium]|nr:amidohydrolase [Sphingomonadaceae bacterium]
MNALDKSIVFKDTDNPFGGRKVVDVDTHLTEPHDLWTSRAPASIRDRVPQVKDVDGQRSWVIDGDLVINQGARPASTIGRDGIKLPGLDFMDLSFDSCHPASHSTSDRVELMDATGIAAQVIYPNILGFGGQNAAKVDPELRLACIEIYNDAMAEMQQDSGQRIFPMALLPWWDVKQAVAEIERTQAMGLRGININSDPHNHTGLDGEQLPSLDSEKWNPMWEACQALDLPINFHIGASDQMMDWFGDQAWPSIDQDIAMRIGSAMLFVNNGRVMMNIILSGMLDRYEKLNFVSVESGLGWIPFTLEALDSQYMEASPSSRKLRKMPSEYFSSNFLSCFWFERKNLSKTIKELGAHTVMFETDFPHPTCLYPIDDVDTAMGDLTEEEKVMVLSGNAERVYKLPI